MLDTKLTKLLKTFTPAEIKKFGKFVSSPYFYSVKNAGFLFRELKKYYPEFNSPKLSKETLFNKIHPQQKYNDNLVKVYMSELFRLGKEFLTFESFQQEPILSSKKVLLSELQRRKLDSFYESEWKKVKDIIKLQQTRSEFYYYDLYRLNILKNSFFSFKSRIHSELDKSAEIDALLKSFFLGFFKRNFICLMNEESYKNEIDYNLIDSAMSFYKSSHKNKNSITELYFSLIQLKLSEGELTFAKVIHLKNECWNQLEEDDRYYLFVGVENFCNKMIIQSDNKFADFLFKFYNDYQKHSYEFFVSNITPTGFRNYVRTALMVNQIIAAESFVKKYGKYLKPSMRENAYNLSYAEIQLAKKNFESAIDYLSKIRKTEPKEKALIQILYLILYFETGSYEQAISVLDSFKHFLKNNNSLSRKRKEEIKKFLNLFEELMKIKCGTKSSLLPEILKTKLDSSEVIRKQWLSEKINELQPVSKKRAI